MESNMMPLNFNPNRSKNNSGFTIIELLIALAIMAVLASLAYASFSNFKELARIARCIEEIRSMEREIAAYATEKGEIPADLRDINRHELKDPWGKLYHYHPAAKPVDITNAGPNNRINSAGTLNSDYDLYSLGANDTFNQDINEPESEDDIIRASDGSFVGKAKDYGL